MTNAQRILREVAERTRGRDQADAPEDFAFIEGHSLATQAARIAAFGAIRRAAEVARRIERDTTWDDVDDGLGDLITAAGIREAIRAAIGSDKS